MALTPSDLRKIEASVSAIVDVAVTRLQSTMNTKIEAVLIEVRSLRQDIEAMKQMTTEDAVAETERVTALDQRMIVIEKHLGIVA